MASKASTRGSPGGSKQLSDADKALEDKDSTVEQQNKELVSSEDAMSRLGSEAENLQHKISELEAVIIKQDNLKAKLDESHDQVEALNEQVEKMKMDVADKSTLEEELAQKQEQVGALEDENADLRKSLQGKVDLLEACTAAKDTAQTLADKCQADLGQATAELAQVRSLQKSMQEKYSLSMKNEKDFQKKWQSECALRQATHDQLLAEQGSREEKEVEVQGLQASAESKDGEIQALKDSVQSKDKEIEQLRCLLADRDSELKSQNGSVAQLRADLDEARREKEDAELDLGLVISLGIRPADVHVQDWVPLLRSLRVGAPVESSPDVDMSAQAWAVLPSWPTSSPDEEGGFGSSELPCVPSSPDSLLFELFGHAMAEGDIRCDQCLRAIATLSAQVVRHGVAKVSSFVIVLAKLGARVRSLGAISGYQVMLLLGLRYLAALVRSRVPGALGLAAVEDSFDVMMEQAGESLGVIRHVSRALCTSGDIDSAGADWALRLNSTEGRSLMLLAEPRHPDDLFLLADPEGRTVRAVSSERCDINIRLNEAEDFVKSAVINAPPGRPDIELALTEEEADWIQEHF